MTTDQINIAPAHPGPPPPATVQLDEGWLACRSCGVAVAPGAHVEVVKRYVGPPTPNPAHRNIGSFDALEFTRCPECIDRHARAEEMAHRLPRLAAVVGNKVAETLALALDVYAAIDRPTPDTERMDYADAAMMARELAFVGNGAQYAATATEGTAAGAPWRHLSHDKRQHLRAAYARLLARRVAVNAPPVTMPCPNGRGCLMCGVNALTVPAFHVHDLGGVDGATRRLWHPLNASGGALGGGAAAAWHHGHVCPGCARAIEDAGAVGPAALARSYVAHLKGEGKDTFGIDPNETLFDGLTAHVVTGRAPSATRWEHVGELVRG